MEAENRLIDEILQMVRQLSEDEQHQLRVGLARQVLPFANPRIFAMLNEDARRMRQRISSS